MAETERVTVTKREGTTDSSGAWTVIGIIVGLAIVVGVVAFLIGGPQIAAWWGGDGSSGTTVADVTPAGSTHTTNTTVSDGNSSTTSSTTQTQ